MTRALIIIAAIGIGQFAGYVHAKAAHDLAQAEQNRGM